MTTERQARSEFMFWCQQVRAYERGYSAVAMKGDPIAFREYLDRFRIARASKQAALEQLRLWRGAPAPRGRPVRLYG